MHVLYSVKKHCLNVCSTCIPQHTCMHRYISCEMLYRVFSNGMRAWFMSRYLFYERILDSSQTPLSTQNGYFSHSLTSSCVTESRLCLILNVYSCVVIAVWKQSDHTQCISGRTTALRQFDCSSHLHK